MPTRNYRYRAFRPRGWLRIISLFQDRLILLPDTMTLEKGVMVEPAAVGDL